MQSLTDTQRLAAETDASDVLLVAGAGSGKTRTLVARVVHLITKRGLSPSQILVITFTRKAAGEVRERITQAISDITGTDGDREIRGMSVGTFHSYGLKVLRSHGDRLGYEPSTLTVVSPEDAELLLTMCARDMGYLKGKAWKDKLSLRRLKAVLESDYTGRPDPEVEHIERYRKIVTAYHARLFEMNSLDFGMILRRCRELLSDPDVLSRYTGHFRVVLVDELQDSDAVQYDLHDFLAPPLPFFGVGDRRQSIYLFRGARPDLMTDRHPDAEVIDLCDCFRCGDLIVDAANKLIAHNNDPLAKPMVGRTGRMGQVQTITGRSEDIASFVLTLRDRGYQWGDIAILGRRHKEIERIAGFMGQNEIPYHCVGAGFDVCKTPEFLLIHALLRLCVNPRDEMAALRVADELVAPDALAHLRYRAARHETTLLAQMAEYSVSEAVDCAVGVHKGIGDGKPHDAHHVSICLAARVVSTSLRNLAGVTNFWGEHCDGMSIREALDWYATRDSQDDAAAGNVVTLSTVHAAKGLEWPVVIVPNMQEGSFPLNAAIKEDSVDEERRLAYVAFTRARELLVVHRRLPSDQSTKGKYSPPSRFLDEAGIPSTPFGR